MSRKLLFSRNLRLCIEADISKKIKIVLFPIGSINFTEMIFLLTMALVVAKWNWCFVSICKNNVNGNCPIEHDNWHQTFSNVNNSGAHTDTHTHTHTNVQILSTLNLANLIVHLYAKWNLLLGFSAMVSETLISPFNMKRGIYPYNFIAMLFFLAKLLSLSIQLRWNNRYLWLNNVFAAQRSRANFYALDASYLSF